MSTTTNSSRDSSTESDLKHPTQERNLGVGITIRSRDTGGMRFYAVYHHNEQVSDEKAGPAGDDLLPWARGFAEAKITL